MCACVGAFGSVCWNPTFQLSVFVALLAAAACSYGHYYYACVYACVVMDVWVYALCVCAPCTYSHGRTAIALQLCVDHFHACVDIAYVCVCDGCVL